MAGRAGAVVGAHRRRSRARGRGYDRTARPPVYLSQQRSAATGERFQALAPVAVCAFLEGYGYETRSDTDMWLLRPGVATGVSTPTLTMEVAGHEERGGHTWYQLKTSLEFSGAARAPLRWSSERRLSSLREELHDRVKEVLGQNYTAHFLKTPFALKGGLPGTTSRLNAWFGSLGKVVNKGEAPPSLVALLLQFLEAPHPPEEIPEADHEDEEQADGPASEPPVLAAPAEQAEVPQGAKPTEESELEEIELSLSE
ncbi:unnamed protein product [Durusdinium trenchii]|uniref:Uncharacterized protein n=1 Tax=Durusdinium trenchii TaxID=1381693 RepID=A0ABP0LKI0_9DINO|eukprot:g23010.t1